VVLEDSKNTKNDLEFCPSQGFESDRIAKDYAALLALWHFQKTLPLERFDIIDFDEFFILITDFAGWRILWFHFAYRPFG
jgi:hypothetical protein